jgi:hypothetical protein
MNILKSYDLYSMTLKKIENFDGRVKTWLDGSCLTF